VILSELTVLCVMVMVAVYREGSSTLLVHFVFNFIFRKLFHPSSFHDFSLFDAFLDLRTAQERGMQDTYPFIRLMTSKHHPSLAD